MYYKRRLKGLRVSKGLTQMDLANILNMPKSTYAKKENQKSTFSIEEAIGVSKALGVSLEAIFINN